MRARINEIPPKEEATWGAVLATLLRSSQRGEMTYHWTANGKGEPGTYSVIDMIKPGEDVAGLRAEIEAVVELVNSVARRDPLNSMAPADPGLIEVLID